MENTPKICIIGAGFSGLCAAIKLKTDVKLETFTIFEACTEVGGTWLVNTYPGCACDVPSHLYSFSFAPKYDWSQSYSPQPEILEYTKDVARKYGIYPHVRFETRVETLRWDEKTLKWRASIRDIQKETIESLDFDIVINGTGKIRIPHYPEEYLGFKGPLLHSAEWDHSVSLEGKRVGVVGTGSSAVQIISTIASSVEKLTVFQRKPPYILPRMQFEYSGIWKWAFANVPLAYKLSRAMQFWTFETFAYPLTRYESWPNKLGVKLLKWFRTSQIKDPELLKKTTPEYPLTCKRTVISDSYYKTLAQPNVDLVTCKIASVSGNVIKTEDGNEMELDVLILATGYQPHDFFSPMKVFGKDGVDVLEEWKKDRPKGHMGIISHDMPNFFTLLGPYTALGHNSNMFNIECQVHWTMLAIKSMLEKEAHCLTLTKEAEDKFMKYLDENWTSTVWGNAQCGSWYLNAEGVNTTLWPVHQIEFWRQCNKFDENMFHFTQ